MSGNKCGTRPRAALYGVDLLTDSTACPQITQSLRIYLNSIDKISASHCAVTPWIVSRS